MFLRRLDCRRLIVLTGLLTSLAATVVFSTVSSSASSLDSSSADSSSANAKPLTDASINERTIHFEYDSFRIQHPLVRLRINGQEPLWFVLDTGTDSEMFLYPWAMHALKLQLTDKHAATVDASHTVTCRYTTPIRQIEFVDDGTSFSATDHAIAALVYNSHPDEYYGTRHVAGVIGMALMSRHGICFDFPAHKATFFDSTPPQQYASACTHLPLTIEGSGDYSTCIVNVNYPNDRSVRCVVDTGSPDTYLRAADARGLKPLGEFLASDPVPARQNSSVRGVLLSGVSVGGFSESNVLLRATDDLTDALLGLNILTRFRVTLDLDHKEMVLERPADYAQRAKAVGESGLRIVQQNRQFVIDRLLSGGSANKAGVQAGDVLVAVDDIAVADLTLPEVRALLRGLADSPIRLNVKRGSQEISAAYARGNLFAAAKPIGIGISLTRENDDRVSISRLTLNSPGLTAGLQAGDEVLAVEGFSLQEYSIEEVSKELEKPLGAEVTIRIKRKGEDKPREVKLNISHLS